MMRTVQQQYEYVKQLGIGFIQEGNKLPSEYRAKLSQEIAMEMLKDKAHVQRNSELDWAISILESIKK